MAGVPYVLGRRRRDLARLLSDKAAKLDERDKVFAATRVDELQISEVAEATFAHCTFLNISFKGVTLSDCNFQDCVFVACYFRRGTWKRCRFQACRFIDCQFTGLQIAESSLFYSRFSECFVEYSHIESCLPGQANLRRDLAHNLATEAARLGFSEEAAKFRWCEVEANERHLRGALFQEDPWYRTHYPGLVDQLRAGLALTLKWFNRQIWGYGERVRVLLRNLAILVFVVFPLAFYLSSLAGELHKDSGKLRPLDYFYFSLQHILEPTVSSGITSNGWAAGIAAFEGLVGIIIAGLLVSCLFQWILRR